MVNINREVNKDKKVFVAMSGGVDSSVVAALMKEQGYDVVGVTMCFSITHPDSKKPSCCGVDGIQDAKRAAQILDIPHYVLDFAKDINEHIIDNFTDEYINGRTPNPCALQPIPEIRHTIPESHEPRRGLPGDGTLCQDPLQPGA